MAVKGIGFVGMRTDRLDETVALFRDVIGLPLTGLSRDTAAFTLADGAFIELFGPGETDHAAFTTGPVVGFHVDDFDGVLRALVEAGVVLIGGVERAGGTRWQHFRCPDGTVAEITGPDASPEA